MTASNSAAQVSTILYTGRMPIDCRRARTRSGSPSAMPNAAICLSENPSRLASHNSSRVGCAASSNRRSMPTMRSMARRNHPSTWVWASSSSGVAPRRRAAMSAHTRRSVAGNNGSWRQSLRSRHSCASHSIDCPLISSERTAFENAASKERSIAMTSPVAFICVLMPRSPVGNLSNGQRGILTTQ